MIITQKELVRFCRELYRLTEVLYSLLQNLTSSLCVINTDKSWLKWPDDMHFPLWLWEDCNTVARSLISILNKCSALPPDWTHLSQNATLVCRLWNKHSASDSSYNKAVKSFACTCIKCVVKSYLDLWVKSVVLMKYYLESARCVTGFCKLYK